MTNREIVDKVESWNWNANIFEIYDEVRYMNSADQHALLNHAYEYFKYDSTMYELMSFLGVEVEEYNLCGEHKVDLTPTS